MYTPCEARSAIGHAWQVTGAGPGAALHNEGQAAELTTAEAELMAKQQAAPERGIAQLRCGLPALLYNQLMVHQTCYTRHLRNTLHQPPTNSLINVKKNALRSSLTAMLSTRHSHHRQHSTAEHTGHDGKRNGTHGARSCPQASITMRPCTHAAPCALDLSTLALCGMPACTGRMPTPHLALQPMSWPHTLLGSGGEPGVLTPQPQLHNRYASTHKH